MRFHCICKIFKSNENNVVHIHNKNEKEFRDEPKRELR